MQRKTPLVEALAGYERLVAHRLHVPAHGRGSILSRRARSVIGHHAYAMDVTEVDGLDDLFDPRGAIARAQHLAAEAYGADHTLFCTCGSSSALIAAVLAASATREVIIPRHCHVSHIHACVLGGITPRFVGADIDRDSGLILRMNRGQLAAAIQGTSADVPIVFINPTYHGVATSIPATAAGRIVIADEAHGAHFPFHPALPSSLSESGAAVVVSGMHKTGGALTQTSLIRIHGSIPVHVIRRSLRLVHTSSPSYPLMASIDLARSWLATNGHKVLDRTIDLSRMLERTLTDKLGLECPCRSLAAQSRIDGYDPLRVVFSAGQLDSGWLIQELRRSGIQLEMEDGRNLVGVLGLATSEDTVISLLAALDVLLSRAPAADPVRRGAATMTSQAMALTPDLQLPPAEAYFSPARTVSWDASAGEIAGEVAAVHPPGVAIVVPGQRITRDTIDLVNCLRKAGSRFQGTADPDLATIRVAGRQGQ